MNPIEFNAWLAKEILVHERALRGYLSRFEDAIDAIMSNRHLVAHGKDSGISLARVSVYLRKSVEVIEFIEKQCQL
jgi:hypothetical protein